MVVKSLSGIRKIHILGACGTLMGAFAVWLRRSNIEVSGTDQDVYPPMSDVLAKANVRLFSGYRAENLEGLDSAKDLVVVGNVIRADNPEAQAARQSKIPTTSLPEFMEKYLLPQTTNLVVAGTHGKTTTASLLAHVLRSCGEDPSYFVGGVSYDLPDSFYVSTKERGYFVLEGDEYDTVFWDKVPKFNHYLPNHVILTSVEFDHADIYKDLDAVKKAFCGLMERVREPGSILACGEYPNVLEVTRAKTPKAKLRTYGFADHCDVRAVDIELGQAFTRFSVLEKGKKSPLITMQYAGRHNVLNALSVWALCKELGLPEAGVIAALASAKGVKRRQEVRGEVGGVLVIDDFAHHPTAVRETLAALRAKYPERRIVVAFEPRSATSRRKVFQKDYAEAFDLAELTFICQAYDQSRILETDQFSSAQLVEDLRARGRSSELMPSALEGVNQVKAHVQKGDLVAVLSNGGFGGFIQKFLEALKG